MTWHDLGALPLHAPTCVKVAGREIALFRTGKTVAALDNACPHQGGPLVEGVVQGGHVLCPWHGWRFDLATGTCTTIARDSTRSYPTREIDGRIEIDVD